MCAFVLHRKLCVPTWQVAPSVSSVYECDVDWLILKSVDWIVALLDLQETLYPHVFVWLGVCQDGFDQDGFDSSTLTDYNAYASGNCKVAFKVLMVVIQCFNPISFFVQSCYGFHVLMIDVVLFVIQIGT